MTMTKKPDAEPLAYTLCEAADLLHCSVITIRRLVRSGVLHGFSLGGRKNVVTRVSAQSVRDLIEGRS